MKDEESSELKKKIPGENPFRVPESYFDSFASRLQDRISAEQRVEAPRVQVNPGMLRMRLIPVMSVAAVLVLAALLTFRWYRHLSPEIQPMEVSELIEYSGYNFDENQLIDELQQSTDSLQVQEEESLVIDYLSAQETDPTDASIEL